MSLRIVKTSYYLYTFKYEYIEWCYWYEVPTVIIPRSYTFRIFYFWPGFHPFIGSLPPISSNTGQPKIVATPAEVIDNLNQASVWKPSSPAIILPINAFGQTLTPSIEKDAYPTNVSASIGRTAYLKCKIKNLGHKSVWNLICHQNNYLIMR